MLWLFLSLCLMIKSFVQIFICDWWLCPELYLRRPFHSHASSRLDNLLEAKAKQGVQVSPSFFGYYRHQAIFFFLKKVEPLAIPFAMPYQLY